MTCSAFNDSITVGGLEFLEMWGVLNVVGVDITTERIGEMGVC